MKQFLIAHTDDDGNNLDLFVTAATPEDAVPLWIAYYDLILSEDSDRTVRVFEVPARVDFPVAHAWNHIEQVEITVEPNDDVEAIFSDEDAEDTFEAAR